ncbi:nitrate assimilation regulatory nira [Fusarium longipes]|uniref:Nitrate assimilation regulatory nira n=1 Tax=Fusarium longipes TaxID=694270 RepID=A0A395SWU7_9HYPO|nr:nitrate assimilation regulatory nira [Fusarium longipes]
MIPQRNSSISGASSSSAAESNPPNNLRPLVPASRPAENTSTHAYRTAPLCNGGRPPCSQCRSRHIECVYRQTPDADFREKYESLWESHPAAVVYRAIQTRSRAEALEIVRRIQNGIDAETLMHQLTVADPLLQVQLEPETRTRYQFVYSPLMPEYLQEAGNPFMKSLIHEWSHRDDASVIASPTLPEHDLGYKALYLRPHHAASIVDARLDEIVPSKWTSVKASDDMMRELIRFYFLQEYDWFTFFQKDYFLDDMVSGSTTFCSSLLVNAVLAVGCQCRNYISQPAAFWDPQCFGYKFMEEARRLWILEMTRNRNLTTLQAALVLNSIVNMFDMDPLSKAYLVQATNMAQELDLFEPTTYIMNKKLRNSYDLTAWSFFHWQSTLSYQFMTVPVLETPPRSPVPDPKRDPEWFGEIWLKYPSSSVLIPLQTGILFKARMDFAVVLNEAMLQVHQHTPEGELTRNGSAKIMEVVQKLQHWHSTLPKALDPSEIVFPSQLKIQQKQVVDFDEDQILQSLSMYRAQFETILRIHYLRHSFEYGNMMLTRFLSMLAFLTLNKLSNLTTESRDNQKTSGLDVGDTDPKEARATLIMAQKGLSDQGRGYYLPKALLRDVLGHMTASDATILQSIIAIAPEGPNEAQERKLLLEGHCPPDILKITKDPSQQLEGNWIQRFTILTLGEKSGQLILSMISGGKDN